MSYEYDAFLAALTDEELREHILYNWSYHDIARGASGAEDERLIFGFNCDHKRGGHKDPNCSVCRRYHEVVAQDRRLHAACHVIQEPRDQARELAAAFDDDG